jgi:hypothetical protein
MMSATLVRTMKPCDDDDIEIKRGLGSFWIFANVSGQERCSGGFSSAACTPLSDRDYTEHSSSTATATFTSGAYNRAGGALLADCISPAVATHRMYPFTTLVPVAAVSACRALLLGLVTTVSLAIIMVSKHVRMSFDITPCTSHDADEVLLQLPVAHQQYSSGTQAGRQICHCPATQHLAPGDEAAHTPLQLLLLLLLTSSPCTGDDRGYAFRQILNLLPLGRVRAASTDSSADQAVVTAEAQEQAVQPATPISFADRPAEEQASLTELLHLNSQATGKCSGDTCYKPVIKSNSDVSVARAELAPLPKIVSLGNGAYSTDILCSSDIPDVETTYMTCYVRLPNDK